MYRMYKATRKPITQLTDMKIIAKVLSDDEEESLSYLARPRPIVELYENIGAYYFMKS